MKILHLNDLHSDTSNPESRIDNYYEAMNHKLQVILNLVVSEKVDAVAATGDIFHKKDPSRVPYRLANTLRDFFITICRDAQVVWIYGNHDKRSDLRDFWTAQPLHSVMTAVEKICPDKIHHVSMDCPFYCSKESIAFVGMDHNYTFDSVEYDFLSFIDACRKVKANKYDPDGNHKVCLLMHQAISPDKYHYPYFTRKLSALDKCEADYVLCGHLHEDVGVTEYQPGKYFVNHGSIMRGSIHEHNLKRTPKICILDTNTNEFKTYDLTSKKADDIFDLEAIEYRKQTSGEIKKFAESLSQFSVDASSQEVTSEVLESKEEKYLFDTYMNSVGSTQAKRREIIVEHAGYNPFK